MLKSMIDSETGKRLSLDAIRQNEADTSSGSEGGKSIDEEQGDINTDGEMTPPPVGRDEEIKLAESRVLERRMQLLLQGREH